MPPVDTRPMTDASFLPEDYVERRTEQRTNVFSIALFTITTLGVVGAFLVTNRQWNDVKSYQQAVNVRYTQAAKDIEQLKMLEAQQGERMERAQVTTALIEKVPRSILLAELVNRMPATITLLSAEINSTRLDKPVKIFAHKDASQKDPRKPAPGTAAANKAGAKSLTGGAKPLAKDEKPPVTAPRFDTRVLLTGVASTHNEVADYVAKLQECALLTGVDLIFSEGITVDGRPVNRFRIEADLKADADARRIQPMHAPRLPTLQQTPGGNAAPAQGAPAGQAAHEEAAPPADGKGDWRTDPTVPRPTSSSGLPNMPD